MSFLFVYIGVVFQLNIPLRVNKVFQFFLSKLGRWSFIYPDGGREGWAQQMVDLSGGERMGQCYNSQVKEGEYSEFTSHFKSVKTCCSVLC